MSDSAAIRPPNPRKVTAVGESSKAVEAGSMMSLASLIAQAGPIPVPIPALLSPIVGEASVHGKEKEEENGGFGPDPATPPPPTTTTTSAAAAPAQPQPDMGKMSLLTSLLGATAPASPSPSRARSSTGKGGVKRKREKIKKDDNVERDKWGKIIKTCGINGCTHRTGNSTNMKVHKANSHGIGVTWFQCPEEGCIFQTKMKQVIPPPLVRYDSFHSDTSPAPVSAPKKSQGRQAQH